MFIPTTDQEKKGMLQTIGVSSFEDLIRNLPQDLLRPPLRLPPRLTELELVREVQRLADKQPRLNSFLGAGAYEHFIPAAVWTLAMRGEFLTAYTPYQAEASQGTLQTMYEFQSLICELFRMEVSNASMYDGSSALAEAVLMALRHTGRSKVLYSQALHPHHIQTLGTYLSELNGVDLSEIPCPGGVLDGGALENRLDDRTAAVVVQHPNFFGCLEPVDRLEAPVHAAGALLVACVNPVSLGMLAPPGDWGADIAAAEGQPLGLPLEYGGPSLGILTCREALMRKMPGRVCGMTVDREGKRGFVLTLQAREQHIRREKATSNICTNVALCALAAAIHLSVLGPQGLKELGELNLQLAHDLAERLAELKGFGLLFDAPFFNEFVLRTPIPASRIQLKLLEKGIVAGLPLSQFYPDMEHALMVCATETKSERDLNALVEALRSCSRR